MRTSLPILALLLVAGSLAAQRASDGPAVRHALRVAYVGEPDTARANAFAAFLRARFTSADVFARFAGDAADLQTYDVVLLDWPQSDAARKQRAAGGSPLGTRDAWHTPTVLLGSAGLNLACAWQVRGGSG